MTEPSEFADAPEHVDFPEFVKPLTSHQARVRRWRHNLTSWLNVPLQVLGGRPDDGTFGILMYHRVCPRPRDRFAPTYHVTPDALGKQLDWLLRHGFTAWPLSRLVEHRLANERIKERVFAVTFDDGYANNCTHALPVLKELGVPATLFVATAYVGSDQPYPFDDWMLGAEAWPDPVCWQPASWDQLEEFQTSQQMEIGAHTHTHADFRDDVEGFEQDLRHCHGILKQKLGIDQPLFSYPFGNPDLGFNNAQLAGVARSLGCRCGLQVGNGLVRPTTDIFQWSRFDVASGDTGRSLAGKLDGWSERLRNVRRSSMGRWNGRHRHAS